MSTKFCDETSFLDGALVKIVNRKERLISYKNCTETTDITVYAAFTARARTSDEVANRHRIRACAHTMLTYTVLQDSAACEGSVAAAGKTARATPAAGGGGELRRVVVFVAKAIVPPMQTRAFVTFDLIDDVQNGKEYFATEPCPLDLSTLTFQGGRRRADDVLVKGPDRGVMPTFDRVHRCLGNPRDPTGKTNWLYRLTATDTAAPSSTARAGQKKRTHTQLWAFYNDCAYAVATVRAVFQLSRGEKVEPCGSTTIVSTDEAVRNAGTPVANTCMVGLQLRVPPLTTCLFARVTRRRPSLLALRSSPTASAAAPSSASHLSDEHEDAAGDALVEYNLDGDDDDADEAISAEDEWLSFFSGDPSAPPFSEAVAFVAFSFYTDPYRSISPLGVEALGHVKLPHSVECDQVFPCPRTRVDANERHSGGSGVALFGGRVPVPDSRSSSSPHPQRRLSDGCEHRFPSTSSSPAAVDTVSTDVFLLVDSEANQWTLYNQSSTLRYHVYVTVYAVASPDAWYATFAPSSSQAPLTSRTRDGDEAVHVRRAYSQPEAVVVEVVMEPLAIVPLCCGTLPDSFDMACVCDGVVATDENPRPAACAIHPMASNNNSRHNSSLLLERSISTQYVSLPGSSGFFTENPSLVNDPLTVALADQQNALPDQEEVSKSGVVFDGPGPDESVFPYNTLYAVFPRRVVTTTTFSQPTTRANSPVATLAVTTAAGVGAYSSTMRAGRSKTTNDTNSSVDAPPVPPLALALPTSATAVTASSGAAPRISPPPLSRGGSHLGTNGALFRLVSADGTRWGLYNDTNNLNMLVHVIFTMDRNMFGHALDARQHALGETQLLTTPWLPPTCEQQQNPYRHATPRAQDHRVVNLPLRGVNETSLSRYATPRADALAAALSFGDADASDSARPPSPASHPAHKSCDGIPSPTMLSRLSGAGRGAGDGEAGHIARLFQHALVMVPPHTTVPFLAATGAVDLAGCRFHAWAQPIPLATPPAFTHAKALEVACEAKDFVCDEVFEVCHGAGPNFTLYKLVDAPLIRYTQPHRRDAHVVTSAPEKEKAHMTVQNGDERPRADPKTLTLEEDEASALTRARWAFFNDSDAWCFTVSLTFNPHDLVTAVDAEVFVETSSGPHPIGLPPAAANLCGAEGDWTVVSGTVTGVTEPDGACQGTEMSASLATTVDTGSALNRLRIVNVYASPEPPSAMTYGSRFASLPASPRIEPSASVTTIWATVWPGDMLVFAEMSADVTATSMRVRADRPPQNNAPNVAFEGGNPVIYRQLADYDRLRREHQRRSRATPAELPSHLQGVAAPPRSPVDAFLHVDDMLTKHYLRFYRDYPSAPIYRIVNDRDKLWSIYNDHTHRTYRVCVVFLGMSRVRPLGAARDISTSCREHAKKGGTAAMSRQQRTQRRLSDKDSSPGKDARTADEQMSQLLRDDPEATVVDVVVAPGETELLVASEDVTRYVVFLEKQPLARESLAAQKK